MKKTILSISLFTFISACGGGSSSSDKVTPQPLPIPVTNNAPIAVIDSAIAQNNLSVTIDVLANDTDAENSTLSIVAVSVAPEHGMAEVVNGNIVYNPTNNYAGTDTLSYQITDGNLTAQASVNITVNHTLTLVGLVTDAPLANATVTATLNGNSFITTTDDIGNYQLPIVVSDIDAPIFIHAKGSEAADQKNIELVKMIGNPPALLNSIDGERNLTAGNDKTTNVTHLSTAAYLLAKDRNDNQMFNSGEEFQTIKAELSSVSILNTAGFIKLLVDNPAYLIPDGQSILTLLDPTDASISTSTAIESYLNDNNYIDNNGQTTQSYNDALANAIAETIADPNVTIQFTTDMLAGKVFIELDASQKGWLTDSGNGLHFNDNGTLTNYVNSDSADLALIGTSTQTQNWHISEGKLILTPEPEVFYIDAYYPYNELMTEYGFDISVIQALRLAHESAELPFWLQIKASVGYGSQKVTVLGKNSDAIHVNYTGEYEYQFNMDDLAHYGVIWSDNNPISSSTISYQKTYAKASSTIFSDKTLSDISGRWAMPFDHFVGIDFLNGEDINGLYHDTIQINETSAVSDISAHHFIPSLENGTLTLTENNVVYKVTPIKHSGKNYLAKIEKWQNNELVYVVAEKIALFDESYTLFTSSLVTEMPMAQLAYIGSTGVDAWQNNKLRVNYVFGYHFKSDGTLNRGIYAATDFDNNTSFQGDNRWTWSQNENVVTLDLNSNDRHRTWQIISVDNEGRALVLESSVRTKDHNNDGDISDDERARIWIRPRINIIKQTDLSQWADTWQNTQF